MAGIPTMACPECDGRPLRMNEDCTTYGCTGCDSTGRIPRPPLTAEEIAALPDGAICVIVWMSGITKANATEARRQVRLGRKIKDRARVWLADPPPLCTICREHHGREVEHPCE